MKILSFLTLFLSLNSYAEFALVYHAYSDVVTGDEALFVIDIEEKLEANTSLRCAIYEESPVTSSAPSYLISVTNEGEYYVSVQKILEQEQAVATSSIYKKASDVLANLSFGDGYVGTDISFASQKNLNLLIPGSDEGPSFKIIRHKIGGQNNGSVQFEVNSDLSVSVQCEVEKNY